MHNHSRHIIRRVCIVGAVVVLALAVRNRSLARSDDFASQADEYLTNITRQESFSGSVLLATEGNVVFAKAYGLANREHGVANTTDTLFRLGSVTKQFTAMCILILQDEHKLSVTDHVSKYVPDCPAAWRDITIHHLLTHTSGIPNLTDFPGNVQRQRLPSTTEATVALFKDKPLLFEPGAKMQYSNSGYVLLGYIIEKVSGERYDQFISERIFQPLGMKRSGYDHPADILPNRAAGYARDGGKIVNCIPFAMDLPHAGGALYSTVGDLLIWDRALYSNRLVSTSSLQSMFTPYKDGYCYGWYVPKVGLRYPGLLLATLAGYVSGAHKYDRAVFDHGGSIAGFRACVARFPEDRVYVAVLGNFEWVDATAVAENLAQMYFQRQR